MADIDNNKQPDEPLGILSLNVNGMGDAKKRYAVMHWLKQHHNASKKIVFFQETHSTEKNEKGWKDDWKHSTVEFSHGTSGSKGVVIIIPDTINHKINEVIKSKDGRYLAINSTINGNHFLLVNCYAPNITKSKDQLTWLKKIHEILDKHSDLNIIIGGDLNDCFIPHLDRYRCKPNAVATEYVNAWKLLCEDLNLSDFWRICNPNEKQYTWRQGGKNSQLKQSRLDYWIVSTHLMFQLENVEIQTSMRSDHSLISINFFKNHAPDRGPSFWRYNASLIKDPDYITQIKSCIKNSISKYKQNTDKGLMWDLIKMEIRSTTICFSKNKAKKTRENIKEAILNTEKLEKLLSSNPTEEITKKYYESKELIESYNNEKANGAILRSKVAWAEFGERNSKYFLNLEKRNHNMKCITKLLKDDDTEITEPGKILEYEESFYKNLYSKPNKDPIQLQDQEVATNKFKNNTIPKITEENKQQCDMEITIHETGIALKDLQNGKSPGSDGFTPDFYKFFWLDIKEVVFESIVYASQNNQLSIDQKRGIINLIPKKDKDPRLLKNWRPISLLNTDYKIITKILANRIKKVLPTVINPDQVAYLKKRFIGQNIRTIFDIMGYTKLNDKNGIIAFLDFEKAFDTIRWEVIYDALRLFNFGKNFIDWVHTIYRNSEACVTNNGFSSPFFKLERGVRQGCPLSAYLFITVVELLAHKIRTTDTIKGIKVGDTEIKLVQMADDTTAFVEDEKSLENMFILLKLFEQYAGLKLNKTKTEAMWLGKDINNTSTPLAIKWVKQVHSLGIFFSYDTDSVMLKNFMDRAKEFKRILDMWTQRDLSLIGKITILKSLAFSKIIYQCGVITPPPKFLEQIIDTAYKFIWNNKKDKVKRKTLIADYKHGGLKMLDIQSFVKAQKVIWIKRFLSPETASWKALLTLSLNEFMGENTFKCFMDCKTQPKNFPDFYWEMMKIWCDIKNITESIDNPMDIRRQCLWFNENISINKEQLNWKVWREKGINIIHDILNNKGDFLSVQEIEQKYNYKCDVMTYNRLKNTIPQEWRRLLKTMKITEEAINFKEEIYVKIGKINKNINIVKNKEIYWILVNDIRVESIIMDKLQRELNIEEEKCNLVFTMSRVIRNTKIQAFQFKLLYNLIPTNQYLKRITRSDTDICHWCNKTDDIAHYFILCTALVPFWNSFTNWCQDMMEEEINFTVVDIIVGILTNTEKYDTINACILMAKWHIYKCKLDHSDACFYKYLCELKYNINIEKSIALKNNKLTEYVSKWQIVENQLT
jgi:exonuclease III